VDGSGTVEVGAHALAEVRRAVSRVLEVDPAVLRADTPLAGLGCDPVALIAIADLLLGDAPVESVDELGALVRRARTIGDLGPVVGWGGGP
jgi:hypothetical protein